MELGPAKKLAAGRRLGAGDKSPAAWSSRLMSRCRRNGVRISGPELEVYSPAARILLFYRQKSGTYLEGPGL